MVRSTRRLLRQVPGARPVWRWARRFWGGGGDPFLPEESYSDDVWLVSYPKSGNTWVRFLLANALYPNQDVDFHTIQRLIPEVGKEEMWKEEVQKPRIIKSHSSYNSEYNRTIYILRDGRDVYVSYYYYMEVDKEVPFEKFVEEDKWPVYWSRHVNGWLDAAEREENILVTRYEDLKEDDERELGRMLTFIEERPDENEQIKRAAHNSRFEEMRRIEQEKGRPYGGEREFVRKGKKSGWEGVFSEEAKKIFKEREGETLIRCGYEEDLEW